MNRLFKIKEIQADLIIAIVITISFFLYLLLSGKSGIICSKYDIYLSLSATFLGFLITAYAILITFPDSYKIRLLKKHEDFPTLFDAFILGIYILIIQFVLSFIGFIFEISNEFFCLLVLFTLIYSVIFVMRIVWILKKLTNIFHSAFENNSSEN